MHSHTWTTRAILHTQTIEDEKTLYHDIKRELQALKLQIDQVEDLEAARVCGEALERLLRVFASASIPDLEQQHSYKEGDTP